MFDVKNWFYVRERRDEEADEWDHVPESSQIDSAAPLDSYDKNVFQDPVEEGEWLHVSHVPSIQRGWHRLSKKRASLGGGGEDEGEEEQKQGDDNDEASIMVTATATAMAAVTTAPAARTKAPNTNTTGARTGDTNADAVKEKDIAKCTPVTAISTAPASTIPRATCDRCSYHRQW
ncbi:hypothetical protein F5X99DRAFT_364816 [Biscogniauxia marginata]|nr:hypothetical protein F5X99DRAFT_364816 [Biscogniauxia marginata]